MKCQTPVRPFENAVLHEYHAFSIGLAPRSPLATANAAITSASGVPLGQPKPGISRGYHQPNSATPYSSKLLSPYGAGGFPSKAGVSQ